MEIYKLPDLDLTGDLDVETAAKRIFKECALHLSMNFERFRDEQDESALMQIRIGMRRTRVALQVFKQIIPPEIKKRLFREFRYFGNLLGEARDMDVFLAGMLNKDCPIEGLEADYAHLRYHAQMRRDDEYQIIQLEITGGRFEKVFKSFEKWRKSDWSDHLGRPGRKILKGPIEPFALEILEDGRQDLLNKGAFIEERSTEELHRVRKFVKRSRYHLRFFASLIDPVKLNEGYDILVAMQDTLGHVNDVKEGMAQFSYLCADVKAEHVANILKLIARKIQLSSDEVAGHLHAFQNSWHLYEDYDVTTKDLISAA